MGFDMNVIDPDAELKGKVEDLRTRSWALFAKLKETEDEQAQQAIWDQIDELDQERTKIDLTSFRLNNSNMHAMCQTMLQLGMVTMAYDQQPFPKIEDFGLSHADLGLLCDCDTQEERENHPKVGAFGKARDAHLKDSFGASLIPVHKFGSNDGWHVTPEEIDNALASMAEHKGEYDEKTWDSIVSPWVDEDGKSRFEAWVEFLRYAKDHGGFKVS